jgi:hypothetical protein
MQPNILKSHVKLMGEDGNPFAIFGRGPRAARQAGLPKRRPTVLCSWRKPFSPAELLSSVNLALGHFHEARSQRCKFARLSLVSGKIGRSIAETGTKGAAPVVTIFANQ